MTRPKWLAVFQSRRMAVLFLLGFSSGLPLYLTGSTLRAWLSTTDVSLEQIAAFSLVGLAYTFKFCWAPLIDRYQLPFLGRRRGWAMITQIALVFAIVAMGLVDPLTKPGTLATLAVIVAALSATQDVVLDAYNSDILAPAERAAGAAVFVIGYRVAMLITGTLALFLSAYIPWSLIYALIASLMLVGIVATWLAEEPQAPARPATTIVQAVYLPFLELFRRLGVRGALVVLAFVATYQFGDYFVQALLITFFNRGLGYDLAEIGLFYKILGFAGIFVGGMSAGTLVARFGLRRMLFTFGILQASTNLLYAWLAVSGPSYPVFGTAVLVDQLAGAMGAAAFVGFLMSVCSKSVSATQLALLHSLSSLGQRVFGPLSDDIVVRIDAPGVVHYATAKLRAAEIIEAPLRDAVARHDVGQIYDLLVFHGKLVRIFEPQGPGAVVYHQWPVFFTVTALMAIPGILLALAAAKYASEPRGEPVPLGDSR